MTTCACCGIGCVEIKCPFLLKEMSIEQYAKRKASCLVIAENGNISLDSNHSYYYQIQQQMALSKTMHCDFVVWSPTEMLPNV